MSRDGRGCGEALLYVIGITVVLLGAWIYSQCTGEGWFGGDDNDTASVITVSSENFTSVSAGAYHTCGVKADGTVVCWGVNEDGRATPPPGQFLSLSAGGSHTCGVRIGGSVECWGSNGNSRTGDFVGQATPRTVPSLRSAPAGRTLAG